MRFAILRSRVPRVAAATLALTIGAGSFATGAHAAQLIARGAHDVHLAVNAHGFALVTYRSEGRVTHLLAGGAINAHRPSRTRRQVRFTLDYSGGTLAGGKPIWSPFGSHCKKYDGPPIYAVVAACRAPNGSYWAVQAFQYGLPDLGFQPWLKEQRVEWFYLSHWSGSLPVLSVGQVWNHIFGTLTYRGKGVYGFGSKGRGAPADSYGRLALLDTHDSTYGRGWRRENSFLTARPNGVRGRPPGGFSYEFTTRQATRKAYRLPPGVPSGTERGPATGDRYRISANGPGVTPFVEWMGPALPQTRRPNGFYDPASIIAAARATRAPIARLFGYTTPPGWLVGPTDDFGGPLGTNWQLSSTGGASVSPGVGLAVSLPQGHASSVALTSRSAYQQLGFNSAHSALVGAYAWIDLGEAGIPPGAAMLLAFQDIRLPDYLGARIADGQIEIVEKVLPTEAGEKVLASAAYEPGRMRFIFWRLTFLFGYDTYRLEVYSAASSVGPFQKLLTATPLVHVGPKWFTHGGSECYPMLEFSGDGHTARKFTIGSVNF